MLRSTLALCLVIASILLALVLGCLGVETAATHPAGWILALLGVAYLVALPLARPVARVFDALLGRGNGSLWLVVAGSLGVLFGAPVEHLALYETLPGEDLLEAAGVTCAATAAALCAWAQRRRCNLQHAKARMEEFVDLPRGGPQHALRHPGYAAVLLLALGLALGCGSAIALVMTFCLLLPGLALRICAEDRHMVERLGTA